MREGHGLVESQKGVIMKDAYSACPFEVLIIKV